MGIHSVSSYNVSVETTQIDLIFLHHLVCKSRSKVTINKHLGSTFHFQCKPSPCGGKKFNYTHHNQITGMPDLVVEAPKYSRKLLEFDYGGDYCCSDQCFDGKKITTTDTECCITVASKTT